MAEKDSSSSNHVDQAARDTKQPLRERIEKGSYKGPAGVKPVQPHQEINPRPTNQQSGEGGGGKQSSGDSSGNDG